MNMSKEFRDRFNRSFVKGMLFTKMYVDAHPELIDRLKTRRDEELEKKIEEKLSEKIKELLPKET